MKLKFTLILAFFACLTLQAQNTGLVRFQVDLNCSEPYVDPALISNIVIRAYNIGQMPAPANRDEYDSFTMTETGAGTGIYTYDLINNGGTGNAEVWWYFQAEMTNGMTISEGIGNNWGDNMYGCNIGSHGGDVRKQYFGGSSDRIIRNIFGHCSFVLCGGKDVTFNLEASCSGGANHQFYTIGGSANGELILNGSFLRFPMTDNGDGTYQIKFPFYNNESFIYNYSSDFSATEQGILNSQLMTSQMGVLSWGGRNYFIDPASDDTQTHNERWGSVHGARKPVTFAGSTTVTADSKVTYADGITYYLNGEDMVLGIQDVDIDPSLVSVSFGATEAEHFDNGIGFIDVPDGSSMMRRVYDVNTTITDPVNVLYYYTDSEFAAVNASISANGGSELTAQQEMYMYKVTSADPPLNIEDIDASEVVILENGATASQTTWEYEADCDLNIAKYEVASFSGGGGGGSSGGQAPLPVDLIKFEGKARDHASVLTWTTASELNNDYFEIEHSNNADDFRMIGMIEGKGTSNAINQYDFLHESPKSGINYYRLKQVDFDGKFEYSNTIAVEMNSLGQVSIFPTVTKEQFKILYTGQKTEVAIFNQSGKNVYSKNLDFENGYQDINVANLPSGIYYVQMISDDGREIFKLIKQ